MILDPINVCWNGGVFLICICTHPFLRGYCNTNYYNNLSKRTWLSSKPQHSHFSVLCLCPFSFFTVDESYFVRADTTQFYIANTPLQRLPLCVFQIEKNGVRWKICSCWGFCFQHHSCWWRTSSPISSFWAVLHPNCPKEPYFLCFSRHPFAWFDGILFLEVVVNQDHSLVLRDIKFSEQLKQEVPSLIN